MERLFLQAYQHPNKIAIVDQAGTYSYGKLVDQATRIASFLLGEKGDLNQARVAFMVSPGFDYVAVQWGIWMAGGIAVPLCITYPLPSLQYVIVSYNAFIVL